MSHRSQWFFCCFVFVCLLCPEQALATTQPPKPSTAGKGIDIKLKVLRNKEVSRGRLRILYNSPASISQQQKGAGWRVELIGRKQAKDVVKLEMKLQKKTKKGWKLLSEPSITTHLGKAASVSWGGKVRWTIHITATEFRTKASKVPCKKHR